MVWWHHLVHTQVRNPESQCGQPQPRFSGGSSSACCAALAMAFSTKASAHFAIPICKAQLESVAEIILSVATPEERKPFESGQWRYTSDHIRFIQFCLKIQTPSFQDQSQRWLSSSGQSKPPPESAERTRPRKAAAGGQLRPKLLGSSKNVKGTVSSKFILGPR